MRFAPRNAKDCAFFVPLRSFRRPNDSIRRKFDSGHRPFIARAPKRVMINAGFAVTARFDFWGSTMRKTFTSLAFAALASLGLALTPLPAASQMREIDPSNLQIASDLVHPAPHPVTSPTTKDHSYDSDHATGDPTTSEVQVGYTAGRDGLCNDKIKQ